MSIARGPELITVTEGMEDEKDEDDEGDEEDETPELTSDQLSLLYLISRYSQAATDKDHKEEWIRKIPLMVLIYEGIVAQVLDYDYAPGDTALDRAVFTGGVCCSLGFDQPAASVLQLLAGTRAPPHRV